MWGSFPFGYGPTSGPGGAADVLRSQGSRAKQTRLSGIASGSGTKLSLPVARAFSHPADMPSSRARIDEACRSWSVCFAALAPHDIVDHGFGGEPVNAGDLAAPRLHRYDWCLLGRQNF